MDDKNPAFTFPLASDFSIIVGNLGKSFIYCAIISFILTSVLAFLHRNRDAEDRSSTRFSRIFFILGCLSLVGSIISLGILFFTDQFQYDYVFKHSELGLELWYRVAAIWSGQQGSFLLWGVCTGIVGLVSIRSVGPYYFPYIISYSLFLAAISGILAYESPFAVNDVHGKIYVPPTGTGLEPSLMNYWMVIHPPTIFFGFAMLTILYSWSIAVISTGNYKDWLAPVRIYAISTLTILGLGLCMGGFWAYETLGWGGFWAWDPVENSSFVPWCFTAAFLHGIFIQNRTGKWQIRNVALSGLTLVSFLFGTFLTRSGVLSEASMHSFATMDRMALKLLIALMAVCGTALGLGLIVAARRKNKETPQEEKGSSRLRFHYNRENAYSFGILLLSLVGVACAIGMSVPLIKAIIGDSIAIVEAEVYEKILVWLYIPLIVAIGVAPHLSWNHDSLKSIIGKVWNTFSLSIGLVGCIFIVANHPTWGFKLDLDAFIEIYGDYGIYLVPVVMTVAGIGIFAIVSNISFIISKLRTNPAGIGGYLTHVGLVTLLVGLIFSKAFECKAKAYVQEGKPGAALGYIFNYLGMSEGLYERNNMVLLEVVGNNQHFQARPQLYYTREIGKEPSPFTWPFVYHKPTYDVYFTIGAGVYEATDATTFKKGDDKLFERMMIVYKGMSKEGEAGKIGTKFTAHVEVKTASGTKNYHPKIEIGESGLVFHPERVDENLLLYLQSMDAADYSANLQLFYIKPVYPMEVYIKPLTIFVWIGTGIMTLGGLWSAGYRVLQRRRLMAEKKLFVS